LADRGRRGHDQGLRPGFASRDCSSPPAGVSGCNLLCVSRTLSLTNVSFAYVGGILAAWICFGGLYIKSTWSWRFPVLFQAVGPIIVIVLLFDIPESPRFLMAHGHEDRALRILAKSHANGKMDDPLVQHEMQEIKAALAAEQANKQTSYLDFLRTPANRRRLFVVCVIAIGTNIVGNSVIS
jgi:MFS family permease